MLDELILSQYLVSPDTLKKRVHPFYNETVKITNHLEAHSKGKYPRDIIEAYRPNETTEQKDYRKAAFKPVTKTYFSKAVSVFGKIKKAEDWQVKWEYENTSLPDNETLEEYTSENFPEFDSLENWLWSFQFNTIFDDPNGVIAVFPFPKQNPDDDTEIFKPFPFFFESPSVIEHIPGKFAFLQSSEKSEILKGDDKVQEGLVYYAFDEESYAKCIQVGQKDDYTFMVEFHPIPFKYFPCFNNGGVIEEFKNGRKLWDSFMGDCIPFWDEALARFSDLQVQNVLHVHSEKWEIEDTPCKTCNGTGQIKTNTYMGASQMSYIGCSGCNGTGSISVRSPFGVKTIKPLKQTGFTEGVQIPTPPMGYITKPIEDTKFIRDQFYGNIEDGFAAINMEFVMFEPGVNSGISKAYDRQEINSTLGNVAYHLVKNILEPVYFLCGLWRYSYILPEEEIAKMVPCINVPTKFDVLNEDILLSRLSSLKTAGASTSLLAQSEAQYSKKEFGEDSIQAKMIDATANLDPLPNKTDQDKMTILSNKGTTQRKYILSSNITDFINRAYAENEEFFELTREEQLAVLDPYIQEIIDEQNAMKVPQIVKIPVMPADYEELNKNKNLYGASGSDDSALDKTKGGDSLPVNKV